jgi:MFS family permease
MAIALYSLAPALGPSMGPLIGAWITERTTWRWSFWAVTIFGVLVQVLIYFTLDETYAPEILERKAKRLRQATGNELLHTQYNADDRRLKTVMRTSTSRVLIMLATQPIVQFLALYMALNYGIVYLMLAVFPNVWSTIYHESVGIGGLNYISLMIGMTLGAQTGGRLVDWGYRRLSDRAPDKKGRPEFRVPPLYLSTFLIAGGLFMYGWSAQYHVQWIVPNIGAAIFGAGAIMAVTSLQTYTIDCYERYAASAVGATAVARAVAAFAFPLFAPYMFDALGQGWGNSVLAFSILGIGYSGSLVLWFYGERLRRSSQYAANKGKTG